MENPTNTNEVLKVVINYFDKTALITTAKEAIEFINSLQYRGNSHAITCNQHTENLLQNLFNGSVLPAYGKPFVNYYSLATTGCGNTNINLYLALADTLEEHNKIVALNQEAKAEEEKKAREERAQAHFEEMNENLSGWFVVTVTGTAFKLRGSDGKVTKSVRVLADNKMEAYNKAIKNLEENPPKNVMMWSGFESSRSALIEYIGVWTDESELEYGS